jgi:hypothetical protein
LKELKDAKDYLVAECLNETVLNAKKWESSLKRFKGLRDKFDMAIEDKIEEDYIMTKMVLKTAARLLLNENKPSSYLHSEGGSESTSSL